MLAKVYILKKPRQRDFGRCHVMLNLKNGHFITRGLSAPQQSLPFSDGASGGAWGALAPLPILGTWSPPKLSLKILCIYVLGRRD